MMVIHLAADKLTPSVRSMVVRDLLRLQDVDAVISCSPQLYELVNLMGFEIARADAKPELQILYKDEHWPPELPDVPVLTRGETEGPMTRLHEGSAQVVPELGRIGSDRTSMLMNKTAPLGFGNQWNFLWFR